MHPQIISHDGQRHSLTHLHQSFRKFNWTPKGTDTEITFSVRLRYSDHCYSRKLDDGEVRADNHAIVDNGPPLRVFCPDRYGETPRLCGLIDGLFEKPTTSVALTENRNWAIYQLYIPPDERTASRYTVFFGIRKSNIGPMAGGEHPLDMYIESGYVKDNRVKVLKRAPFGVVATMTMNGEKVF